MTTLKFGKADPDHSKAALLLADHLTGVPVPPSQRDWLSEVTDWPMYGNDAYGDCVWAMIGHAIEAWTRYASGVAVEVSEAALLKGYADVTGFDPHDPSTDQGTVLQDAMNYWKKTGIAGHKILAFAKVNHLDQAELQAAIDIFGALLIGIQFPAVAMQQFDAGQPWAVVKHDGGIEGGHAVHVGAYDASKYELVTWAKVQAMTPGFADKYLDEAWVAITAEWLNAVEQSPEGLDLHSLGEALHQLTGEPNPFPVNPPQPPQPPQPPLPPYPPADADESFAAVLRPWLTKHHLGANKAIADAAKSWLSARRL